MPSTLTDRIDGISTSMAWKVPCRLATTANITLSGTQTIDGVSAVADDRILVKDQTDATENGIYRVQSGAWVRSGDFDGARDIRDGSMIFVTDGSANQLLVFRTSCTNPVTIGTTEMEFFVALNSGASISIEGGSGVDDDLVAFQAAVDYAGTLSGGVSGPYVTIDLRGRTYALSGSVVFDGISNIIVKNGKVKAIGTWADDTDPLFNLLHTGVYRTEAQGIVLKDLFIDCNFKSSGVYCENYFRCAVIDSYVVRFPTVGITTSTIQGTGIKNGDFQLIRVRAEQFQLDVDTVTTLTATGIHIRCADFMMLRCIASRCNVPFKFSELTNGQVIECHPFTGRSTIANVTNVVDNGSGLCRISFDAAHGLTTGDRCYIEEIAPYTTIKPWQNPYHEANFKHGVTVINSTTFDIDEPFVTAYTSGGVLLEARDNVVVESNASGILFSCNYLDHGDMLFRSFDHVVVGNLFTGGATLTLESSVVGERADGMVVMGNRMGDDFGQITTGAGTWDTVLKVAAVGNIKPGGRLVGRVGRIALEGGSAGFPAVIFGDDNTGFFSSAEGQVAFASSGVNVWSYDGTDWVFP